MSRTPSILLLYPSCFYYPNYMERVEVKTSQVLLGSYLAQFFPVRYADFEITIGRANTPLQVRRFERRVREVFEAEPADILAVSCWTSLSWQSTRTVTRIFRELYPDKLIVVGGYHPSARPNDFDTEDHCIDYVICGEGEQALADLARTFPVQGRPERTRVITAPTFPAERFVGYNWDLVDGFIKQNFPEQFTELCLYLARGCPFDCSFCMESLKGRTWRPYTPERALEEVQRAVNRYNLQSVGLADACFGMRPSWRKQFLKLLIETKPSYWVVIETRPEYLDEDDIKLLAQLKTEVQFGIESGSPQILQLMHKTRQPEQFLQRFHEVSQLLTRYEVLHRANMIFNHPGETRVTLKETFDFIDRELQTSPSYLMWACNLYMHFPGCELDRNQRYYEKTFGAHFDAPNWWYEETDQHISSQRTVPSADLDNGNVDLWRTMLAQRDPLMRDVLAPRAFRFTAMKYNLEWRDDPRFE